MGGYIHVRVSGVDGCSRNKLSWSAVGIHHEMLKRGGPAWRRYSQHYLQTGRDVQDILNFGDIPQKGIDIAEMSTMVPSEQNQRIAGS
jgi:hypothetical protein